MACQMEGCVLCADHAGSHTSKPFWPRELRDALAMTTPPEAQQPRPNEAAAHSESCETATWLGSGHDRCQCLCHDGEQSDE